MMPARRTRHRASPRRAHGLERPGSAYLLVLGATMIVTTMAIGAAMVLSTEVTQQGKRAEMIQASLSAQSALEVAAEVFVNESPERKSLSSGASVLAAKIGGLECVVTATSPDGSFISSDKTQPFTLVAYAEGAYASQGVEVGVAPTGLAVTSMDAALHAGGTLAIDASTITGGPSIGAVGNVTSTGATVNCPVYTTAGLVVGSTYGAGTSIVDEKNMPEVSGVAYYAERAQPISYAALGGKIRRCVLGPGVNPFGAASASGRYSINCGGGDLDIEDCRIVGTIVVWNVGTLRVRNQVLWTPASADEPILAVRGNVSFELAAGRLSESSAGTNFNPASVPFQGASDANMSGSFPNALQGVIYVQGNVSVASTLSLAGSLVSTGNIIIKSATCSLARPTDLVTPAGLVPYVLNASGGTARVTR